MPARKHISLTISLVAIAAVAAALYFAWQSRPGYSIEPGIQAVQEAYQYRQTGLMVEVTGSVARLLRPAPEEPELQKFVLRLSNGQSILVVHRAGADSRVPARVNDNVLVRGEYVWTETGGTIRNTERDLSTQRRHGWIEYQGERYN